MLSERAGTDHAAQKAQGKRAGLTLPLAKHGPQFLFGDAQTLVYAQTRPRLRTVLLAGSDPPRTNFHVAKTTPCPNTKQQTIFIQGDPHRFALVRQNSCRWLACTSLLGSKIARRSGRGKFNDIAAGEPAALEHGCALALYRLNVLRQFHHVLYLFVLGTDARAPPLQRPRRRSLLPAVHHTVSALVLRAGGSAVERMAPVCSQHRRFALARASGSLAVVALAAPLNAGTLARSRLGRCGGKLRLVAATAQPRTSPDARHASSGRRKGVSSVASRCHSTGHGVDSECGQHKRTETRAWH